MSDLVIPRGDQYAALNQASRPHMNLVDLLKPNADPKAEQALMAKPPGQAEPVAAAPPKDNAHDANVAKNDNKPNASDSKQNAQKAAGDEAPHFVHTQNAEKLLENAMKNHRDFKKNESYLGRFLDVLYPKESQSYAHLEKLQKEQEAAVNSGNGPMISHLTSKIVRAVDLDEGFVDTKQTIDAYGGTGLKTGMVFIKGRAGMIASSIAYGLDQVKPDTPIDVQVFDGIMGTLKGGVSQYAFDKIGRANWNVGYKAAAMSLSNRAIDVTFTRDTWVDNDGNFNGADGLNKTLFTTFNPRALAVDAGVLGVSELVLAGSGGRIQTLLEKYPLANTVTTASLYGFSSGGSTEALRQSNKNEAWSIPRILKAGENKAVISGLSAFATAFPGSVAGKTDEPPPIALPSRTPLTGPLVPAGVH